MTTPSRFWRVWQPTVDSPWNLRRVVHLRRRAGFAATRREIDRDLNDGPQAAVNRVLAGSARLDGVHDDFEQISKVIGDAAVASENPHRLKAWWLFRMLAGPDPLAERLALLWHNHFATSNLKVESAAAMARQNEIFRAHGRGLYGDLLRRVVHDPSLLLFLDAPANRKEHPNENLARELMELFTLGVGNFGETDVKEAARALTGWTVAPNGQFREAADRHDDGEKTILGRKGAWRGDDLVELLLAQSATAQRLAKRLCEMFLGEEFDFKSSAGRTALDELAGGLRARDLDMGWAVETILRSELFFSDANLGRRIAGPVEFVVGAARALELCDPPPSTVVLAEWAARLGQDLFYPPSVFGWPGGRSWISPRSMIGRANFAAALVAGELGGAGAALDALALLERHGRARNLDEAVLFSCELLLGGPPTESIRAQSAALRESSKRSPGDAARTIVRLVLASPEAQLM